MKQAISAILLTMFLAAGCAQTRMTRFEYGDIRLDVSGRIIGGKTLATVDYQSGIYYCLDQAPKQVMLDVRLASVNLKDQAILGMKWFDGKKTLIAATDLKNTTPKKSPLIVAGGVVGIGTGGGRGRCPHGGTVATCPECSSGGGTGTGIKVPVIGGGRGRDSSKVLSVRATFDLNESIDIEESYLALEIQLGKAINDRIRSQLMLLPMMALQAKVKPPPKPVEEDTVIALIRSDRTILIDGLLEGENEKDIKKKTPILGDIPLLGKLFKSSDAKTTRAPLLIFITPHIILDSE